MRNYLNGENDDLDPKDLPYPDKISSETKLKVESHNIFINEDVTNPDLKLGSVYIIDG